MNILEKEPKSKIKNPLHTKDLLKFKITGQNGTQWFLIRFRLLLNSIHGIVIHGPGSVGPRTRLSTKNFAKRCKDTLNLVDMAMFILDTIILQGKTLQLKSDMIDRLK